MVDSTPEVWLIRGEGGDITPMSPPLGEGIAQRLRTGALLRVNEDGSRWEPEPDEPVPAPKSLVEKRADESKAEATKAPVLAKPAQNENKARWVDYAASTGQITREAAEDLNKAELVERFGK